MPIQAETANLFIAGDKTFFLVIQQGKGQTPGLGCPEFFCKTSPLQTISLIFVL